MQSQRRSILKSPSESLFKSVDLHQTHALKTESASEYSQGYGKPELGPATSNNALI